MNKILKYLSMIVIMLLHTSCGDSGLFSPFEENKTTYVPDYAIYNLASIIDTEQEINESPNWTKIGRISYYNSPYTLQIILNMEYQNIKEIEFKNCDLIIQDETYDLLRDYSSYDTDVSTSVFYMSKSDYSGWGSSTYDQEETDYFLYNNKLLIEISDEFSVDSYHINYSNIPINYETDLEVTVAFEIEITLLDESKHSLSSISNYTQEITQMFY